MSLMDMMVQRGGFPAGNRAQAMQGDMMPPFRGIMPWNSGFEGYIRNVMAEKQRHLSMIDRLMQEMAMKHAQFPIADYKKNG